MKRVLSVGIVAGLIAWTSHLASAAASKPGRIRWEPYIGTAIDGSPLSGELGRIRVPENRRVPSGATIELAFVRYRTTNPDPGPPIFYLVGGPGGPGVESCATIATHPQLRFLEHADVIGLDQRGAGLSRPDLSDPAFTVDLPLDRAIDRKDVIAAFERAAERCVDYWTEQGVDLSAYNTIESVADVDDLREALGLERIVTFGTSYGSHLALAYLRRHSERVARALLTKVEGPDHTWKLPSTVQGHLEKVHEMVAADPAVSRSLPDLMGTVRRLLQALEEEPVMVVSEREDPGVVIGAYDLQLWLSRALAETGDIAAIPAFVARLSRDDWSGLAEIVRESRRESLHSAMALMMDCASGASPARRRRIAGEARDPTNILADAINAPLYARVCDAGTAPDLGDAFRGPMECDVPILFVSGTLDVRTPPSNVEDIRAGFSDHAHVVVTNAGHDARELMSPEYRGLLQAFLRGEPVESCAIRLPTVRFDPIGED